MTQELDHRIKELCERIIKEQDSHVFLDLITERNQRLEERDMILDGQGIRLVSKQSEQLLAQETNSGEHRAHGREDVGLGIADSPPGIT
jgi:hypothetical protein